MDGVCDPLIILLLRQLRIDEGFNIVTSVAERLRNDRVDHSVRAGDRIAAADHAEFKLIASEGKW